MRKVIVKTIQIVGLVLLLVAEDSFLWIGPKLSDAALRPWRAAAFEASCREIKVGMTLDDVIQTMSRREPARYESYRQKPGQDGTGNLVFWIDEYRGTAGDCVISLDSNRVTAIEVHPVRSPGPSPITFN